MKNEPSGDKDPKLFVEFYNPKLTDRQLLLVLLYEIAELKAEVRAISSVLLTAHKTAVSSEQFGNMIDAAQDGALDEIWQHVRQIVSGEQKPPLN